MRRRLLTLVILLMGLSWVVTAQAPEPVALIPEIINVYPHDPEAFTQGLVWFEGKLYESTGLRGESSVREVDVTTGEVLRILPVSRPADQLTTTEDYFAEGLERVGDKLFQLTWTEGEAFVYDLATFEKLDTLTYEGEGWGLCYDGRYFFMSDSTNRLDLRDAETFEHIISFAVTSGERVIRNQLLNELECVGDYVYANLWQTDYIVQIDKFSGAIVGIVDAANLLTEAERQANFAREDGAVLNGIAYNPETDTFFITGKKWDKLFEVRFVQG